MSGAGGWRGPAPPSRSRRAGLRAAAPHPRQRGEPALWGPKSGAPSCVVWPRVRAFWSQQLGLWCSGAGAQAPRSSRPRGTLPLLQRPAPRPSGEAPGPRRAAARGPSARRAPPSAALGAAAAARPLRPSPPGPKPAERLGEMSLQALLPFPHQSIWCLLVNCRGSYILHSNSLSGFLYFEY